MDSTFGTILSKHLKQNHISVKHLADKLGVTTSYIYHLYKQESFSTDTIDRINKALNYNFYSQLGARSRVKEGIPFYNQNVYAGIIESLQTSPPTPDDYVNMPGVIADFALPVSGDSMKPDFETGDIILCRRFSDLDMIPYGHAFVIQAGELHTLKYIRKADKAGDVRLVSANPSYDPIDIPIHRINNLFRVVAKIQPIQL